ncbi:MAG TPA: amidase [Jatrophihabitantaceae bacterium]|nr:amidase [Jatrophihabitantaceae bacterium]
MTALTALSLTETAALLDRHEIDAVELTEAYLRRIDDTEPDLNAYVTVTADRARASAERAASALRAGTARGELTGIPLGLKDLYDMRGVPTRAGSPLLGSRPAGANSTVAERLEYAGAVLLGKHSTHEFAWGGTTNNPHFGPTHNPHDHSRIPGGSSGGSAASVVAGSSAGSFGTDTCGSVRIPAALCGCVGLKPTYGRISLNRVVPLASSLDHGGPIARTVADAALLYRAVAGFDPCDARTLPVPVGDIPLAAGANLPRIGRLRGWFDAILDPDVRTALDGATEALRARGCPVRDIRPARDDAPVDDVFTQVAADAVPWHWATFGRDADGYSPALRMQLAQLPDAETVASAREVVAVEVDALLAALHEVDVLLCATVPAPAPPIGAERVTVDGHEMHVEWMLTRLTSVFDAARLPALSVPFGRTRDGLPIGVQLVGRHLDEGTVLRAGRELERCEGSSP